MGRGDDKVSTNDVSTWFLINIIFDGNAQKALDVAREFPRTTYTLTPKSIERFLIIEYIRNGADNKKIVRDLSRDGIEINMDRVRRIREEMRAGKYSQDDKGVVYGK